MGDMADYTLEQVEDHENDILEYKTGNIHPTKAYELGLIDERGTELWTIRSKKQYGPGDCPECGSKTKLLTGPYGKFYGCIDFPNCKGNLSYR